MSAEEGSSAVRLETLLESLDARVRDEAPKVKHAMETRMCTALQNKDIVRSQSNIAIKLPCSIARLPQLN